MKEDLQRVFIHELGHFVSSELNYKIYKYDRRANEIIIAPRLNTDFYNGSISTNKATPYSYLPEFSAKEYVNIFYGCLFESIYRSIDISKCLKCSVTREEHLIENIGNGKIDALHLFGISNRSEIKHKSSLWYSHVTKVYFPSMQQRRSLFQAFFDLDVRKFIKKEYSNRIEINIENLTIYTSEFIDQHQSIYKQLIEDLESIN